MTLISILCPASGDNFDKKFCLQCEEHYFHDFTISFLATKSMSLISIASVNHVNVQEQNNCATSIGVEAKLKSVILLNPGKEVVFYHFSFYF